MPNNNYLRSRKKEQELVKEFRLETKYSARSASSKSPVDVWAFKPKDRELWMIQVKTKKGSRKLVIEETAVWTKVKVRMLYYRWV